MKTKKSSRKKNVDVKPQPLPKRLQQSTVMEISEEFYDVTEKFKMRRSKQVQGESSRDYVVLDSQELFETDVEMKYCSCQTEQTNSQTALTRKDNASEKENENTVSEKQAPDTRNIGAQRHEDETIPSNVDHQGAEATLSERSTEETTFVDLPHPYRPPPGFKSLRELTPNFVLENIIGVVLRYGTVAPSRGSDLYMTMFLIDPTCYQQPKEVVLFLRNKFKFPEIYGVGDIIVFHRLKANCYKEQLQLMSNHATSFMVFSGTGNEVVSLENARHFSQNPTLSNDTIRAVYQLRKWIRLNITTIKPTQLIRLSDLQPNIHAHVIAKVVKAVRLANPDNYFLVLYDGSHPAAGTTDPPSSTGNRTNHVLWDQSDRTPKADLVSLCIGDKYTHVLSELRMDENSVLLFHSIHVNQDDSGQTRLTLDNEGPLGEPHGVTFLRPSSKLAKKYNL